MVPCSPQLLHGNLILQMRTSHLSQLLCDQSPQSAALWPLTSVSCSVTMQSPQSAALGPVTSVSCSVTSHPSQLLERIRHRKNSTISYKIKLIWEYCVNLNLLVDSKLAISRILIWSRIYSFWSAALNRKHEPYSLLSSRFFHNNQCEENNPDSLNMLPGSAKIIQYGSSFPAIYYTLYSIYCTVLYKKSKSHLILPGCN